MNLNTVISLLTVWANQEETKAKNALTLDNYEAYARHRAAEDAYREAFRRFTVINEATPKSPEACKDYPCDYSCHRAGRCMHAR